MACSRPRSKVNNLNADLFDGLDSTKFLLKSEHCLTDLAELKARAAGFAPCVTVLGYYALGDGGGGIFYWNASSTEATNSGTVFVPDSNPPTGRWKRLVNGALSVKWFRAKNDGTNEDREAIQRAIQFSESSQSPTVWFPPGRYRLTSAIRAEVDNLTLLGSAGTVLLVGSVTAPNTVTVTLLNLTGATLDLGAGTLRADARSY